MIERFLKFDFQPLRILKNFFQRQILNRLIIISINIVILINIDLKYVQIFNLLNLLLIIGVLIIILEIINLILSVIVTVIVEILNLILSLKSGEVGLINVIGGVVIERLVDVIIVVVLELNCVV